MSRPASRRRATARGVWPRTARACCARGSIVNINPECGISPKQLEMSDSATHRLPPHASSMRTCSASCCDRRGRNPNEHGKKSASKIGSITVFVAAWTIRSRTAGNRQRPPLAAAGLRDEHPAGRQRPVAAALQIRGQLVKQPVDAVPLDVGDGLSVDAGRATIGAHQRPRPLQDVSAVDLVSRHLLAQ